MDAIETFGARAEAFHRLGGRFDVRVLEPSPPAVQKEPFADDPVAGGEVVPLDRPDCRSWASLCAEEPGLAPWCAERWLAAWPRLAPLDDAFVGTRRALHAVAEHVLTAARHRANGKIGLRFSRHGFGTPFFGADQQVRVEEGDLVVSQGARQRRNPVTTLADAARQAGLEKPGAPTDVFTPTTSVDPGEALVIDRKSARALGDWFGFSASVLEQLRSESDDASLLQLWPEHFDLAVELGDEASGGRANYGASPGDEAHPEPYLYVGPWDARTGDFWNESWGAGLSYQQLLEADDQRAAALAFLRQGRALLGGS